MKKAVPARRLLSHEFVEFIPEQLQEGVLYVSMTYATAAHRCFCGCGREVVTPLSPTDWTLIYNGEAVSLWPSIGNWSFPCRSHYVIENNRVQWCAEMSQSAIEAGRARDRVLKAAQFSDYSLPNQRHSDDGVHARTRSLPDRAPEVAEPVRQPGLFGRLFAALLGRIGGD